MLQNVPWIVINHSIAARMSLLQRGIIRTLLSRVATWGAMHRQGPAFALAGLPPIDAAAVQPKPFEMPDMSIVFAVPKHKVSCQRGGQVPCVCMCVRAWPRICASER